MERLIYSSPFFRSHFSFCHFAPILNKKTYFRISNKNLVPEVTKSKSYQKKKIYIYRPKRNKERESLTKTLFERFFFPSCATFAPPEKSLRPKEYFTVQTTLLSKNKNKNFLVSSKIFHRKERKKKKRSKISNDDGYLHTIRSFAIICWIRNNFLRS